MCSFGGIGRKIGGDRGLSTVNNRSKCGCNREGWRGRELSSLSLLAPPRVWGGGASWAVGVGDYQTCVASHTSTRRLPFVN